MKVTAFLTDGFETVEALAVIDILRRAGIETVTVSITGNKNVISAQNITVTSDYILGETDIADSDVLFLPGGPGHTSYMESERLLELLKEHNAAGKRIAAICAAPSILGRIGLLEGKKATCFPGFEKYLLGAEVIKAPARVVTDGNITTSRGMGTSLDLGLELVRLLSGEDKCEELARSIQYKD
jgi:4-methyl-5(b-hydroxyethyl)-thiazole monophosphate biosynthesis